MFTGIIQEIGTIAGSDVGGGRIRLTVKAPQSAQELHVNDSVAVNGVCQTVIKRTDETFTVEAVEETLKKTTLNELRAGSRVNLELPMRLGDRLGGHLVLGHVDGVGSVSKLEKKPGSWLITVEFPSQFTQYVIPVGSVAIDGISLTVATLHANTLTVSIIPHTLEKTTLSELGIGTRVNIEFDVLGKYVEALLRRKDDGSSLTAEHLREWGYNA